MTQYPLCPVGVSQELGPHSPLVARLWPGPDNCLLGPCTVFAPSVPIRAQSSGRCKSPSAPPPFIMLCVLSHVDILYFSLEKKLAAVLVRGTWDTSASWGQSEVSPNLSSAHLSTLSLVEPLFAPNTLASQNDQQLPKLPHCSVYRCLCLHCSLCPEHASLQSASCMPTQLQ